MTDRTGWDKFVAKHPIHVVGEFENQHGERYIIYRDGNEAGEATGDTAYITGDELDWMPKVPLLWSGSYFTFSRYERDRIARILWPVLGDREEPA